MRNKELTDMWWPSRIVIVAVVFAVGTYALGAESLVCADKATRPASPDTVDQIVLHQMGVRKIPGLTLVVVRGNTIVKRESYGVASAALCAPVTNRTKFGIGSISKQFTAAAIMLLAQDGKLKLDDSIAGFFPETGDRWKSVT